MTEGNNPTDRSKLGQTKRRILTDKKGIPLSTIITSAASIHNIKVVTDVLDNAVVLKRRPSESSFTKKKRKMIMHYYLCLDREHINPNQ
jgi:hypothetical protein